MDVDFNISGLKELNKELKKLPREFREKALAQSTRAATKIIHDDALRRVPEDTGSLKSSMKLRKQKSVSQWESSYLSTAGGKSKISVLRNRTSNAYYAHMVEFGTKKMSARPFMRPAFDSKQEAAVQQFRKSLKQKITLFNKKLRMTKAR